MENSIRDALLSRGEDEESPKRRGWMVETWRVVCESKKAAAAVAGPLATMGVLVAWNLSGGSDVAADDEGNKVNMSKVAPMLGTLVWMAIWWVMEPVPIAVTALLPLVLFPFLGILEADAVAGTYTNDIVMLMLGTFILALGIERFNLHKRMALKILLVFGGEKMNPRLVLLGFCVGPAFVSMWMSNTACAVMMIPMASGVLKNLKPEAHIPRSRTTSRANSFQYKAGVDSDEEAGPLYDKRAGLLRTAISNDKILNAAESEEDELDANIAIDKFGQAVILAVTYGTCIGGLATLIGCGPNLVLPGILKNRFPGAPDITFMLWLKFAFPLSLIFLICLWLFLCYEYIPSAAVPALQSSLNREMVEKDYRALGRVSFAEKWIFGEFIILIILWLTRTFGDAPGWGYFFNNLPNDGTVSITMAIVLFLVPSKVVEGQRLMDWTTCKKLSWDVMLLLGGGFALSEGIQVSGLSLWLGDRMHFLESVPFVLLTPVMSIIINFTTEFSSNVATATLYLPLLMEVAVAINVHPFFLLIPATFSSSFAFSLPSGTPPNAIAHSTGYLTTSQMIFPGGVMHVIGITLLTVLTPTLGDAVFGLSAPASSLPWI